MAAQNGCRYSKCKTIFQTDIDSLKLISNCIQCYHPLPGIAIARCKGRHADVQVITARAADEMLNIKV